MNEANNDTATHGKRKQSFILTNNVIYASIKLSSTCTL